MSDVTRLSGGNRVIKPYDYHVDYYDTRDVLNNTLIGIWKDDPRLFLDLFHNRREPEAPSAAMKLGKLIHCAMLTPEKLDEEYAQAGDKPASVQQKKYAEARAAGVERHMAWVDAGYTSAYDEEKVEKMEQALRGYIRSLRESKDTYSSSDRYIMEHIMESFSNHKGVQKIWNGGDRQYAEFDVRWRHPCGMECKAKMDRITVDEDKREIAIIDVKTSSGTPRELVNNTERGYNGYTRQLSFYTLALLQKYQLKPEMWKFKYYIVYCGTKTFNTYLIELTEAHVRGYFDDSLLNSLEDQIRTIRKLVLENKDREFNDEQPDFVIGLDDKTLL